MHRVKLFLSGFDQEFRDFTDILHMMPSSKESLIRRWACQPWHCWLKKDSQWLEIIAELFARMPEKPLRRLLSPFRPLIVLPPPNMGQVVRIQGPLVAGALILQLDSKLLLREYPEIIGILAHELGHLSCEATSDALQNDLEADKIAISWGFETELLKALRRDLEIDHPRVRAALAKAA